MILCELATNAILHGAPPVYVQVNVADDVARVEVEDGFPEWCEPAKDSRGMMLVDGLACRWGVDYDSGLGKAVWAELPSGDRSTYVDTGPLVSLSVSLRIGGYQ